MANDSSWASKSRQQYKFARISEYEQTNINREEGHSSHAQSSDDSKFIDFTSDWIQKEYRTVSYMLRYPWSF